MRYIFICVMLLACGPLEPMDETLPLTEETCESKLFRYSDYITELTFDRDTYKAKASECEQKHWLCTHQLSATQKKLVECNILTSVYESDMIADGCIAGAPIGK